MDLTSHDLLQQQTSKISPETVDAIPWVDDGLLVHSPLRCLAYQPTLLAALWRRWFTRGECHAPSVYWCERVCLNCQRTSFRYDKLCCNIACLITSTWGRILIFWLKLVRLSALESVLQLVSIILQLTSELVMALHIIRNRVRCKYSPIMKYNFPTTTPFKMFL